jgi:hypothetical protein
MLRGRAAIVKVMVDLAHHVGIQPIHRLYAA